MEYGHKHSTLAMRLKLDDKGRKACRNGSSESARAASLTSAASSRRPCAAARCLPKNRRAARTHAPW